MFQPARPAFWRFVLLVTALLALLADLNLINLAEQLGVRIFSSSSWMGAIFVLGLIAGLLLLGFAVSFSRMQDSVWGFLEFIPSIVSKQIGLLIIFAASIGFSVVTALPGFKRILSGEDWVRIFIFWFFS